MKTITIDKVKLGPEAPFLLIAGPCVIESLDNLRETAAGLKEITDKLGVGLLFKSSFDKANRSSLTSFRGPGLKKGLDLLEKIKTEFEIPVLSDIHEVAQVESCSKVLDCLQIPAFLARQTDLLVAAARSGLPINIKKGQFMAPSDMGYAVEKMVAQGDFAGLSLCERGSCFGYHNLVVDMRSLVVMRTFGWPIVFDATHSVQLPAALDGQSGGEREYVPYLSAAAVAVGVDGIFMETHPDPSKALCDGPNQWPLGKLEPLLKHLLNIRKARDNFDEEFQV
ncbi:MAG: 3-deoxy-8-phosphooctulonate synthase [Deltaproteobacteria bacterium]|jgi:2-dehydro-3-deoxyphosphooctonate aldolase (KDO 8-P synthase)|nr:3-deoxy-8-phosphooctulonate synthase [Deltaproteobacteria bacterium]